MIALLLIDLQNDFLPGGALAVGEGDQVIPVANRLLPAYPLVVATQDWHPAGHRSFASQHAGKSIGDVIELDGLPQVLWPDHCIQGTWGAQFAPGLDMGGVDHIVQKGTDPQIDSYSGFFDNARRKRTGLEDYLQREGVDEVHIVGLATDYCVKFTALDAVGLGFKTKVILEGVRGVELHEGDCEAAIADMAKAGIEIL
ncbi:bifunctional nicotinamidase/pyrazinamidase [Blastopirellula marina]|uniref:Nicotinamidase n=1 Tax=Blastopirellula marina TaxID=124 RepID=A0A2S8G9T3_9BACT|nr:bifunctional nicotinamidase/pyrazinamidase [Blastopirellula marina]PQO41193.1 bifunctional nicotinamidase/pyrazinamidase [Blastopirellula marina]PTL46069.1 bifunctional nicotinamidase/pyrazinamidase [Blastopirellula marina]